MDSIALLTALHSVILLLILVWEGFSSRQLLNHIPTSSTTSQLFSFLPLMDLWESVFSCLSFFLVLLHCLNLGPTTTAHKREFFPHSAMVDDGQVVGRTIC